MLFLFSRPLASLAIDAESAEKNCYREIFIVHCACPGNGCYRENALGFRLYFSCQGVLHCTDLLRSYVLFLLRKILAGLKFGIRDVAVCSSYLLAKVLNFRVGAAKGLQFFFLLGA